ncbi:MULTISPECIES: acyltransferase [unclassified Burkholderia]|uniref:acyltransferase family protein n=1 Tax=unclassified Burkholderia TaxID=2613784 RepID=UPI000F59F1BB|nr:MULTISPECIES: acyltransferase [unclassified Burkholderia]RQS20529.1 acyltransferase [Burkholderia sp. Bp8995]RQS40362.1 acyltransferase [Burkholderia sp. Bp8989]
MYKSLQAGRAAAALLVVLFHLGAQFSLDKSFGVKWIGQVFEFGKAGVEFFFVLSGFIIVTAHRRDFFNPHRFAAYASKRVIRIYPTYWIVFGAVGLALAASPSLRGSLPEVDVLIRSILLLPQDSTTVGGTGAPVIIVAWSLQWEITFYALIGCFILGRAFAVIAIAFLLVSVATCFHHECTFPAAFFSKHYSALFAFGAGTALLCQSRFRPAYPITVSALGVIAFLGIGVANDLHLITYGLVSSLAYGLASCAIIFGLFKTEETGISLGSHRYIQTLGNASYALYLLHFPIISLLNKFALKIGLHGTSGALISYLPILSACIAASVVFHLWVEKPMLRYLSAFQRFPIFIRG